MLDRGMDAVGSLAHAITCLGIDAHFIVKKKKSIHVRKQG